MATFKEIVTKAVVGKGKKAFVNTYSVQTEEVPTTILGCWVINHQFKAGESNGKINVDGSFDVNIWYSYNDDSKTAVVTKKINYNESVKVNTKEEEGLTGEKDIVVKALKQPSCSNVEIKNGIVEFVIEKELGIEVVGETMVKIAVEESQEEWETIVDEEEKNDEVTDEVIEQIDKTIEEKFI